MEDRSFKEFNDFEQSRLARLMHARDVLESFSADSSDEDDGVILLEETRLKLLGHIEKVSRKAAKDSFVEEDWELSQFWYDKETSILLAKAALECVGRDGRIACISCPSVYNQISKLSESKEHYLLEFDKRFEEKFPGQFVFYDYKSPLELYSKLQSHFDLVIADPPFLSEECLQKFAETINFMANNKVILCTGAVMEETVKNLLHLHTCSFKPQHEKNLGNEFKCFANFDLDEVIARTEN